MKKRFAALFLALAVGMLVFSGCTEPKQAQKAVPTATPPAASADIDAISEASEELEE